MAIFDAGTAPRLLFLVAGCRRGLPQGQHPRSPHKGSASASLRSRHAKAGSEDGILTSACQAHATGASRRRAQALNGRKGALRLAGCDFRVAKGIARHRPLRLITPPEGCDFDGLWREPRGSRSRVSTRTDETA
jgi:hypothetical protein